MKQKTEQNYIATIQKLINENKSLKSGLRESKSKSKLNESSKILIGNDQYGETYVSLSHDKKIVRILQKDKIDNKRISLVLSADEYRQLVKAVGKI